MWNSQVGSPYAPTSCYSCLDHPLNVQDSTVYSEPRPVFRDLREFLQGSVFINTFKALIMRDSQLMNREAYPSG